MILVLTIFTYMMNWMSMESQTTTKMNFIPSTKMMIIYHLHQLHGLISRAIDLQYITLIVTLYSTKILCYLFETLVVYLSLGSKQFVRNERAAFPTFCPYHAKAFFRLHQSVFISTSLISKWSIRKCAWDIITIRRRREKTTGMWFMSILFDCGNWN